VKANSISLQKIFEQTIRYRIPLFQRPYVWNETDNWTPVWDDVRSLAEKKLRTGDSPPHFLGAVVMDQLRGDTGTTETRQVTLPDLGERSWHVDVFAKPAGWLGTFRRSRETGLWFQGKHSIHIKGQ